MHAHLDAHLSSLSLQVCRLQAHSIFLFRVTVSGSCQRTLKTHMHNLHTAMMVGLSICLPCAMYVQDEGLRLLHSKAEIIDELEATLPQWCVSTQSHRHSLRHPRNTACTARERGICDVMPTPSLQHPIASAQWQAKRESHVCGV